ncbi:hypothetical protein NL108_017790 [Boleophthalmus pectinirostris]|nr:hypothetical protein NL108_017790 [Boleophthalmus pectinirostris]
MDLKSWFSPGLVLDHFAEALFYFGDTFDKPKSFFCRSESRVTSGSCDGQVVLGQVVSPGGLGRVRWAGSGGQSWGSWAGEVGVSSFRSLLLLSSAALGSASSS